MSLSRDKPMKRTVSLRSQSKRTRKQATTRKRVVEQLHQRASGRCEAATIVPEVLCGGPMDVDEIIPRSAYPGGHLDPENCQVLCRRHHDWKHAHPTEAHARGLRRWSWERDLTGNPAGEGDGPVRRETAHVLGTGSPEAAGVEACGPGHPDDDRSTR